MVVESWGRRYICVANRIQPFTFRLFSENSRVLMMCSKLFYCSDMPGSRTCSVICIWTRFFNWTYLILLFLQILKPAFTILVDHKTKRFLLLIRGTHSIKDTLTAATGAVVPFHHSVVHEGGVSNLVLGYAHGGMVAAARWIAKLATPRLLQALTSYPDYKLKVLTIW